MGRYRRKSNRELRFTEPLFQEIKQRLTDGESKRSIAKSYGIAESTLRKRIKENTVPKSLGRFKPTFSLEMEASLVAQIKKLDSLFFGVTLKQLQRVVFQFAERNKLNHNFNKEKKQVGKEWAIKFCQRHNLSLRQPEKTSLARTAGFNRPQVERFFTNLKSLYVTHGFTSSTIFNMDETGLLTVPNKLPKVISPKGKKNVGKVVSGERGQLTTAVCCVSASGVYIPPALIFARKRANLQLLDGGPPEAKLMVSDSGNMTSRLFVDWLDHFKNFSKCSKEKPVLLILDNHSTHITLDAIEFCRMNGIIMLSIPPHTSHKLQPLDVGLYSSIKNAYSVEADKWMVSHPGRVINQYQVAALFNSAYSRLATVEKAVNSFKQTGICPYNPDKFSDDDFAPSEVTDVPLPENITDSNAPEISAEVEVTHLPENATVEVMEDTTLSEPGTLASNEAVQTMKQVNNVEIVVNDASILEELAVPGSSKDPVVLFSVPVDEIIPLPKGKRTTMKKRKSQKSEVLTSSPFKNLLEESSKKNQKPKRSAKKVESVKKIVKFSNSSKGKTAGDVCPGCQETYTDPPDIDLIQCSKGRSWWHEDCTSYLGTGQFVCDLCRPD